MTALANCRRPLPREHRWRVHRPERFPSVRGARGLDQAEPGDRRGDSKAKTEPVIFLTHPELEALIDGTRQAGNLSDAVVVAVMGNIGLRPGEAVALDVADVDIAAKRIYVSKTVTFDDDRRHVIEDSPKTATGIRAVPIPRICSMTSTL